MRTSIVVLFSLALIAPATATWAQIPAGITAVDIAPQAASFTNPTGVRFAPGRPGDAFVLEKRGVITIVRGGQRLATPFLDIDSLIAGGTSGSAETGLLGLAFHPDFATNRTFFVSYTDSSDDTVIARYQVQVANPDIADTATATRVLRVDQDFSNHNGGDIHFGPGGYLFIGLGDGGSGDDPCNRSQTISPAGLVNTGSGCPADSAFTTSGGNADSRALLGKILRIDVNGTTPASTTGLCGQPDVAATVPYSIPPGQPSSPSGTLAAACDEVWSMGWRNPWRFSFDRLTGDMFVGDVGQVAQEEISFEPSGQGGRNYGWRCREGTRINTTNGIDAQAPCNDSLVTSTFIAPIITYGRSLGFSVTGGFRYRGPNPQLAGLYIYADYGGRLWSATESGGTWTPTEWTTSGLPSGRQIVSFGEDQLGQIYIVRYDSGNGRIYRIGPDLEAVFANSFEP
jgi:glucose/arabinose dehydrogenase